MSAALTLTSRGSSPPMWEASSRTIPKLRLALVSEARSLGSFTASHDFPVDISMSSIYSIIQVEYCEVPWYTLLPCLLGPLYILLLFFAVFLIRRLRASRTRGSFWVRTSVLAT